MIRAGGEVTPGVVRGAGAHTADWAEMLTLKRNPSGKKP